VPSKGPDPPGGPFPPGYFPVPAAAVGGGVPWVHRRGSHVPGPGLRGPGGLRQAGQALQVDAGDAAAVLAAAERLPDFNRPALVVWASQDRVMPAEHGRSPAKLLPQDNWPRSMTATPSSRRTSPPRSPASSGRLTAAHQSGPGASSEETGQA
jgi:pimeloyl-ACP methyl ester carboxylesterase